tara:strand:- start:1558 stop:1782 length:225 start_codon:yes stop_codon:yes gene_type:complete
MSDILSNKYFLGSVAILVAGIAYYGYGYQPTDISKATNAEETVAATPATEITTVSSSTEGTITNTADTTTTTGD